MVWIIVNEITTVENIERLGHTSGVSQCRGTLHATLRNQDEARLNLNG
jgi:hypothetical protein